MLNVWGQMAKSMDDAEKIEEAIIRLILEHMGDPEAHLGEGGSLTSHKASEIIDHLAKSIIADKIKDNSIGLPQIAFIIFSTYFESLEGYYKTANVNFDAGYGVLTLFTGSTIDDFESIEKVMQYSPDSWTWDKDRILRTAIMLQRRTFLSATISASLTPVSQFVGFRISNNVLYGVVSDGINETVESLLTYSVQVYYRLEYRFFAGDRVEFYVDNELKKTITTNLPTGEDGAKNLLSVYLRTNDNNFKDLRIPYWDLRQSEQ